MADQILIRGLKLRCNIGVPAGERAIAQTLRTHLTLDVPEFQGDDRIEETIDYKEVSDRVVEFVAVGERLLIETLAVDIADLILSEFDVSKVRVELEKFILPNTDWVGVIIERSSLERN
ncbi:MAG: dihydroneopterin aldolase [Akkermansiaceae bacterium]|jgi:dihydroneopterin aldolase